MGFEEFSSAMTKRSLRNVKTELEFLRDSSAITTQQYNAIVNNLPHESSLQAPVNNTAREPTPQPTPAPAHRESEKNGAANGFYGNNNANPPPPAYPSAPAPPAVTLTHATALYVYNPQDTGDLGIAPNVRIAVTEYMNAEWWKGRNERTGQEGIFPRSYVRVEEKSGPVVPVPGPSAPPPSNYGNAPLDVSQGAGQPSEPSKGAEMGKKFGKKLGNAAVFGAGATIGSKIVNGIF